MVTIKDVAKRAGVSVSTASRVLHNNRMISEATKKRVRQAMKELNYSPNYSAQNLVKRQSNTIAIVLPVRENFEALGNNPFFMQIIQGIASVCTDKGFMVSLASGRSEEELIQNVDTLIKSGKIQKFIFLYSKKDDPVFNSAQKEDVDCVVVGQGHGTENNRTYFVDNDNQKAGFDATQFLLSRGYHHILFAYTNLDETVQAARFEGYLQAIKEQNLLPQSLLFSRVDEAENLQHFSDFLEEHRSLDAIIASDDMLAIRIQRQLSWLDKSDKQIGMLSFNNSLVTELASPSLTSVEIFPYQLGEAAAQLLLKEHRSLDKQPVLLPHEIIERASTARGWAKSPTSKYTL
ncbi:LacI family DNA-binding transcriptional regulator [Streptococcus dentiloxodontae]